MRATIMMACNYEAGPVQLNITKALKGDFRPLIRNLGLPLPSESDCLEAGMKRYFNSQSADGKTCARASLPLGLP
jgi:hypothetical protein